MADGTGLRKFSNMYPNRFFDVEIAEQHAITMAAGMASAGCVPVVAMYSSFLQRAYDQVIHDVCMQKLHVVICIDRSGIVGGDGETHQGIFDMAFLRVIPNITIMAPKNFKELEDMLYFAINKMNSPVVIRYPKGSEQYNSTDSTKIEIGKSEIVYESKEKNANENKSEEKPTDIEIVAIGKMVSRAVKIAQRLSEKGINTNVINTRFLKPFDKSIIRKNCKRIVTIEDGTIKGGLYTELLETIMKEKLNIKIKGFGYNDKFIKQGSIAKIEELNGLSEDKIYDEIINFIKENN
jgi:1-deoxy-D-xylulose-5-phosphate synthase